MATFADDTGKLLATNPQVYIIDSATLYAEGGLGTTPLNADNLTTGTVPLARLPSTMTPTAHGARHWEAGDDALTLLTLGGFPFPSDATKFLCGNKTWAVPPSGGNVYTNVANVFTLEQTVSKPSNPYISLVHESGGVDAKRWQIITDATAMYIRPRTDANAAINNGLILIP